MNFTGILTGILSLAGGAGEEQLARFQQTQIHMGMSFGVVLYARDEEVANRAFVAAFARIEALNRMFSDYETDSELNRLCDLAPTAQPVAVSRELAEVLIHAQRLSERTHGAFDVTVGPVTKLWRRARREKKPPAPDRLHDAQAAVGFRYLLVNAEHRTVELKQPKMRIDLGAIAPGYAADEALRELARFGIHRALVNASGDITVGEPPPNESGWKIEIAPLEPGGKPRCTVQLANAAVATSGDAFQFFEWEGKRFSHIVDPRTGWGVPRRSSVSVIASTGIAADSLATAVSVLGPEMGLPMIEVTPGAAAFIVDVESDKVRTLLSSRWPLDSNSKPDQPAEAGRSPKQRTTTGRRQPAG